MNGSQKTWITGYLIALALIFILLGLGYDTLTPIFEHSDESLHYPYIQHLGDGNGLPLATEGQLWNQEGTQPPLYYAIVAATTFWIDDSNLLEHLQRNPHWQFTEVRPLLNDNQNVYLHGPMGDFPYQNAALAIHIGRWWSLIFGLITVIATFFLIRHLFPDNIPLLLTATSLAALTPQFIRVSATVSNDSLAAALMTVGVLIAVKTVEPPHVDRWWPPILLGVVSGLALMTKLSSLGTLFIVLLVIGVYLVLLGRASLLKAVQWGLIIVAIVAAMTGWWFWRNFALYGEWLATETHLNLAGRGELSLLDLWNLRPEAERAYWATFGWGQIRPPESVFRVLSWFTLVGLIGLLVGLFVRLQELSSLTKSLALSDDELRGHIERLHLDKLAILIIWAALNLILYLRWITEVGSVSHTRLIFPAIAAISLLLVFGWYSLLPKEIGLWFGGIIAASLLALNVYALFGLLSPAFMPPQVEQAPANALDLTFLDAMQVTGSTLPNGSLTEDEVALLEVQWQVLDEMDDDYSLAATLIAPDGSVLSQRETYPGLGLRPTRYLNTGETFTDVYPLRLETDISEPMIARASVTMFDYESARRDGFPAVDGEGNEITPIIGQVKLVPLEWPIYQPTQPIEVTFGEAITLIGYDVTPPSALASAENTAEITLYWRAETDIREDYVVFAHLFDEDGNVLEQIDSPPTGEVYPTRWWQAGEVIADRRTVPHSDDGLLRIGLYDPTDGSRLPITAADQPHQDEGVELQLP